MAVGEEEPIKMKLIDMLRVNVESFHLIKKATLHIKKLWRDLPGLAFTLQDELEAKSPNLP